MRILTGSRFPVQLLLSEAILQLLFRGRGALVKKTHSVPNVAAGTKAMHAGKRETEALATGYRVSKGAERGKHMLRRKPYNRGLLIKRKHKVHKVE